MPTLIACPTCDLHIQISEATSGKNITCPKCKQSIIAPVIPTSEPKVAKLINEADWKIAPPIESKQNTPSLSEESPRKAERPRRDSLKGDDQKYCVECGEIIRVKAEICPKCGVRQPRINNDYDENDDDSYYKNKASSKLPAGLCGILIGCLGVHKFILGYTTSGIIMLLVSIVGSFCYFLGPLVMCVIGLVEGIIYLTKTDKEFYQTYIARKREWF